MIQLFNKCYIFTITISPAPPPLVKEAMLFLSGAIVKHSLSGITTSCSTTKTPGHRINLLERWEGGKQKNEEERLHIFETFRKVAGK